MGEGAGSGSRTAIGAGTSGAEAVMGGGGRATGASTGAVTGGALRPAATTATISATAPSDGPAIEAERARGMALRAERLEELAGRARGRWQVDHFKWRRDSEASAAQDEDQFGPPRSSPGVRAYLHTEPFPAAQCARLGRGVVVRDGVSLCALDTYRDRVVETRLVEDLKKCVPDGSRMRSVSVGGSVVAMVWDKTLGGGASLVSVLDVDLTALGLA